MATGRDYAASISLNSGQAAKTAGLDWFLYADHIGSEATVRELSDIWRINSVKKSLSFKKRR